MIAQRAKALDVLVEDPGSVTSAHMADYNHLYL